MSTEITTALLGLISGVLLAFVGAYVTAVFERRRERRAKVEETRFRIYMKLMDLHSWYFWLASAEMRKEEPATGTRPKLQELAFKISDELRSADEVEKLEEILDVLFCEPAYDTAMKRYHAIQSLLDELGSQVNPRFAKKIREIGERNVSEVDRTPLTNPRRSNAPGSFS
jgi:hypothetical protein